MWKQQYTLYLDNIQQFVDHYPNRKLDSHADIENSVIWENRNSNSVTVYLLISIHILNMETMYGPTHHVIDQGTVFQERKYSLDMKYLKVVGKTGEFDHIRNFGDTVFTKWTGHDLRMNFLNADCKKKIFLLKISHFMIIQQKKIVGNVQEYSPHPLTSLQVSPMHTGIST